MSPKEYLSQIRKLNNRINQMIREKEELKQCRFGLSGTDFSRDRVQTSPKPGAAFERLEDKIEAKEWEIDCLIDEYVDLRWKIIGEIQALPDQNYVDVLYKKYAEFKSLKKIAVELEYSYDHIRRIHSNALKAFEKMPHNATF